MTTASARPAFDDALRHYAATLGFPSLSSYIIWCRKNGLAIQRDKTESQLAIERQLAADTLRPIAPHPGRSHTPGRARLIDRGLPRRDSLQMRCIRSAGSSSRSSPRPQTPSTVKLSTTCSSHVERRADLLGLKMGFLNRTREEGNNYEDALGQLARHYGDWLRPVEEWRTDHLSPRAQFRSLTRYLLARYEVPPFMDTAFLQGDLPTAHREQEWFKHIGIGQNIRKADLPLRLTKRMAHLFPSAHRHWSVSRALRWAQFTGMGGRTSRAVLSTRLRDYQHDEPFWETVMLFFANQPMLEPTYIGPIVDYIHYQKFVPQQLPGPNGQFIEGPPAQPNFSMKGRSITKLLRLVDEWHGDLNADDYALGEEDAWEASGFRGFEWEEEDAFSGERVQWSIRELRTTLDLLAEGRVMHHCAASYARRCSEGERSVWSMQMTYPAKLPQRILTIALDNHKKTVVDYRGKYNMHPHDNKRTAKKHWQDRPYLYYLRQSPRILRLWMEREDLRHD